MIIENKHTSQRVQVTQDQYKLLVDLGYSRHWAVIENQDHIPQTEKAKEIPKEIVDFSKQRETEPEPEPRTPHHDEDEEPEKKPQRTKRKSKTKTE